MRKILFFGSMLIACMATILSCQQLDNGSQSLTINNGAEFLSLDAKSHTGTLRIDSPTPWKLQSETDWLTFSATQGQLGHTSITINMQQNKGNARFTTLSFNNGTHDKSFVVSQSAEGTGFSSPTHYFYVTFGTLPTLYAGLYMLGINKPSYFFFERSKTFNTDKFPPHVTVAPYYAADQALMRDYMKAQIRNINRDNPTAVFGLMVDDLRSRLGYDWFVAQGIDSSRVKVTMLSDGTGTYNIFNQTFGNETTAQTEWENVVTEIDNLNWNHSGNYPSIEADPSNDNSLALGNRPKSRALTEFESWTWAYNLSTRPNYRLLLQYADLLETDSQFIKEQLPKMDVISKTPYELLNQLGSSNKYRFYEMAGFDYTKFHDLFSASAKPNLIIIGTSNQPNQQLVYTRKIYDQYSATHDIFFKPHPADITYENYETEFPGLKLLPAQMPFEILTWSLLDEIQMIGGFPSTIFLSVPIDKVEFIFAPNAESLARPLNLLFANSQTVEWIQ